MPRRFRVRATTSYSSKAVRLRHQASKSARHPVLSTPSLLDHSAELLDGCANIALCGFGVLTPQFAVTQASTNQS